MPEPATPSGDRVREAVERLRETATSAGMSAGKEGEPFLATGRAGKFYVAELEQRAAGGIHETTEAGIARAYDLEFARPGRDAVRFRRLAAGDGAMERPEPAEACKLVAPVRTTRWGYGGWFLLAAVALLPLDLAVRRWRR